MRQELTSEEEQSLAHLLTLAGGLGRRQSLNYITKAERTAARALCAKGYVTISDFEFSVTNTPLGFGSSAEALMTYRRSRLSFVHVV